MHGDGGGGGGHSAGGHGRSGHLGADPYSTAGRRKPGGGALVARFVLGLVVLVAIAVVITGIASKL